MHDSPAAPDLARHRLLFIGGLHRSGTTLLEDVLAEHPAISGLTNTGVPHDEGQHLQDVYPTARVGGGPGLFARDAGAHLTEADVDDADAARARLFAAWAPYWDLDREVLVEKSPPNLLRFRYLATVFPDAKFVAIVRHPVAVAYATEHWSGESIDRLIEHWLVAHEQFERDRPHVEQLLFLRYEDFVQDVPATLARVDEFLGVAAHTTDTPVRADTNARYFARWTHTRVVPARFRIARAARRYEARVRALGYGYSLHDTPT